jgi:hypothetical protein
MIYYIPQIALMQGKILTDFIREDLERQQEYGFQTQPVVLLLKRKAAFSKSKNIFV